MPVCQIKKIFRITLYFALFQCGNVSAVSADSIGASLILLSVHTNPGILALREQYPRRINSNGQYVLTPGFEGFYEQQLAQGTLNIDAMRFAAAAGYDCADMKFGYLHWGARWVFPWTERLLLEAGLGPSLIFRESWTKRFAELVDDEEGFWAESDQFMPGYQHKWVIGGNLELQYQWASNWQVYWALVPAVNILVINSIGVKYSFK